MFVLQLLNLRFVNVGLHFINTVKQPIILLIIVDEPVYKNLMNKLVEITKGIVI